MKMENIEEAQINEDGSVTIRYYFGKTIIVPMVVMHTLYEDLVYEEKNRDAKI